MGKGTTICCIGTTFLVLGGISVLIAWSVDKIKNPSFSIDQATLSNYTLTTSNHLNATFTLLVRSHNRDPKYALTYNSIMVAVFHDTYAIAYVTNVGPWALPPHGDDFVFSSQPVANDFMVLDTVVAGDMRDEANKDGQLRFDVRIRGYVKFEVKGWRRKRYTLGIVCSPLVINLASGNSFDGTKALFFSAYFQPVSDQLSFYQLSPARISSAQLL